MKINLSDIDDSSFKIKTVYFCGEESYLVTPNHIGCKFTQKNSIFRSSVWSKNGELLSGGFKKFVNLGENPENFPAPKSLKGAKLVFKEDGSLAIVDLYKGKLNIRSRGTSDAFMLDNGDEWKHALDKYPQIREMCEEYPDVSFLFEMVTPNPAYRIVLKYPKIDLILIGAVDKKDYSLFLQNELDELAGQYKLNRPDYFNFDDIDDLVSSIEGAKNIEGCCLYTNKGQTIHKIKSLEYRMKHRLKDELGSYERVVDFYFTQGSPSYQEFYQKIVDLVDYETAEECRGDISRIVDGMKEVQQIVSYMHSFVKDLEGKSRKEQALTIQQAYGGGANRCGMVFSILDGKSLTNDNLKKLLYQVTKK